MADEHVKNKLPKLILSTDTPIQIEVNPNDLSDISGSKDDNTWTRGDIVNVIIQIIIIFAMIYSVILTHKSWKSSKEALAKSDTAQQKSTEQFLLINRPFVTAKEFKWIDLYALGKLRADVDITNVGSYPARLYRFYYGLGANEQELDVQLNSITQIKSMQERSVFLLEETGGSTLELIFPEALGSDVKDGIKNDCITLYVLVVLDYEALIDSKKYRNILYLKSFGKDLKKGEILKNETFLMQ